MLKILKIKACSGLSDSKVPTLSRCRHIETLKLALQVDDGIDFTNKCKAFEKFIPPKKENRSYAYICQTQCCNMPTLQRFIYYKYPLIISLDFGNSLSPALANFKSLG
jgi:hypothetical protein